MKSLSLKWKLAMIGCLPLAFFVFLSVKELHSSFETYGDAKQTLVNMELVRMASQVVHEVQIERGKTASFYGGTVSALDLDAQRAVSDQRLKEIPERLKASSLPAASKEKISATIEKFSALRAQASEKRAPVAEVVKQYTGQINNFLDLQLQVAEITSLAEIKSPLYSAAILEDAKENSGKLRANLTPILAQNAPIDDDRFSLISSAKSKADANLESPALVLTGEVKQLVSEFISSTEWREVTRVFKLVISKAPEGKFNQDPKNFFETITTSIGKLGKIVSIQHGVVEARVSEVVSATKRVLFWNLIFLLVAVTSLVVLLMSMIRKLSVSLQSIADKLSTGSNEVALASEGIASSGTELSSAATEQAAALQETVSSVDEINAMVTKNAEAAGKSKELATRSQEASGMGKRTVDEMIAAIQKISESNQEITSQMEQSNQEISDIVKVIKAIGEKTKVINDIVFQTKLLSFNASVEAARAGEHGKGFAVVAEEVGNLAQMSGNAAKEISDMLEASIRKVEDIVSETKTRVDRLVVLGREKVDSGTKIAHRCGEALDQILENTSTVNGIVNEIAVASNEQAQGIQEVTKAMAQLDQVTQQNTVVAQQSSSAAVQLSTQADELKFVVSELMELINGNGLPQAKKEFAPSKESQKNSSKVVHISSGSAAKRENARAPMKMAAGSEYRSVPSHNDPRFDEV